MCDDLDIQQAKATYTRGNILISIKYRKGGAIVKIKLFKAFCNSRFTVVIYGCNIINLLYKNLKAHIW